VILSVDVAKETVGSYPDIKINLDSSSDSDDNDLYCVPDGIFCAKSAKWKVAVTTKMHFTH
jgi:hypothetical protein